MRSRLAYAERPGQIAAEGPVTLLLSVPGWTTASSRGASHGTGA
jgi:hypothetical protein